MKTIPLKSLAIPTILIATVALAGCGSTTGTRTVSSAAIGAASGAIIGSLSAQAGAGALIGLGAGAIGGYLYDQHLKGNL